MRLLLLFFIFLLQTSDTKVQASVARKADHINSCSSTTIFNTFYFIGGGFANCTCNNYAVIVERKNLDLRTHLKRLNSAQYVFQKALRYWRPV